MAKRIRGVMFEENLKNSMGLEFYNLSHRFGYQSPNWPYFEDVKIERIHYMAKSGVLSQLVDLLCNLTIVNLLLESLLSFGTGHGSENLDGVGGGFLRRFQFLRCKYGRWDQR